MLDQANTQSTWSGLYHTHSEAQYLPGQIVTGSVLGWNRRIYINTQNTFNLEQRAVQHILEEIQHRNTCTTGTAQNDLKLWTSLGLLVTCQ